MQTKERIISHTNSMNDRYVVEYGIDNDVFVVHGTRYARYKNRGRWGKYWDMPDREIIQYFPELECLLPLRGRDINGIRHNTHWSRLLRQLVAEIQQRDVRKIALTQVCDLFMITEEQAIEAANMLGSIDKWEEQERFVRDYVDMLKPIWAYAAQHAINFLKNEEEQKQ